MTDQLIAPPFLIGNLLKKSFQVTIRNFIKFFLIFLIPVVPVLFLFPWIVLNVGTEELPSGTLIVMLVVALLFIMASLFSYSLIMAGSIQYLRSGQFSIMACVNPVVRQMFWIFLTGLLAAVLILIGTLLLIIPGVFLYLALFVVVPCCLIEGIGPFASLRRSFELTKGSRWRILGSVLVVFVIMVLIGVVIAVLELVTGGSSIFVSLFSIIFNISTYVFLTVMISVAYHDLRISKEGLDTDDIAEQFA